MRRIKGVEELRLVAGSWLSALFPFRRQGIKIVAAFFEQPFFHEALNCINDGRTSTGIIAARLEQFVQIEYLLIQVPEHIQNFLRQVFHTQPPLTHSSIRLYSFLCYLQFDIWALAVPTPDKAT